MRLITPFFLACLLMTAGCQSQEPAPSAAAEAQEGAEQAATAEAEPTAAQDHEAHGAEAAGGPQGTALPSGATLYGQALSAERELVALADIAADPERFAGQVVKTSGEIAQVCQRMGCWMELREEGVAPVRVPMAGHAFFLPRDSAGRTATIEGTVGLRELSADEREHLESEGATATTHALHISATGVAIDAEG